MINISTAPDATRRYPERGVSSFRWCYCACAFSAAPKATGSYPEANSKIMNMKYFVWPCLPEASGSYLERKRKESRRQCRTVFEYRWCYSYFFYFIFVLFCLPLALLDICEYFHIICLYSSTFPLCFEFLRCHINTR